MVAVLLILAIGSGLQEWLRLYSEGENLAALAAAESLVASDSSSSDAWALLALSARRTGETPAVVDRYSSRALALDSTSSLAWASRAFSMLEEDPEASRDLFDRAIRLDSTMTLAWEGLGRARTALGDLDGALSAMDRALSLDSSYAPAAIGRADLFAELGVPREGAEFLDLWLRDRRNVPGALLDLAELWHQAGFVEEALAACDNLASIRPSDQEALRTKGLILERENRLAEAIKVYREVLGTDSTDLWVHGELGLCFEQLGLEDKAREWYEKGLALDSSYAWAAMRLGMLDRSEQNLEKAMEWFDLAVQKAPEMVDAWKERGLALEDLGRYQEAAESYRNALEYAPRDSWIWGELGFVLEQMGRLEEAAEAYEAGVRVNPEYIWGWQQRGLLYETMGDEEGAVRWFRRAVRSTEPNAWILGELGSLLENQGDEDSARICYRRSIRLDSCYTFGRISLSRLMQRNGRFEEALEQTRRYMECGGDPEIAMTEMALLHDLMGDDAIADSLAGVVEREYTDAWATLAWSYHYSNLDDFALLAAERAEAKSPVDPDSWLSLAELYAYLDRPGLAESSYRRAAELDSVATQPLVAWGNFLSDRGDYERAARMHRRALERDSLSAEAWLFLGESLIFASKYDDAEAALDTLLKLDPGSVYAVSYLGLIRERQGRPLEAVDYYLQALESSPGYDYAEQRIETIVDPSYDADWWKSDAAEFSASAWLDMSLERGNQEESTYKGGLEATWRMDRNGSGITLEGSAGLEERDDLETSNTAYASIRAEYYLTEKIYLETSSSWDRQPLTVRPWQLSSYLAVGYKNWISDWAWFAPEMGAGMVNSKWSLLDKSREIDQWTGYVSLGIWLSKQGSYLPELWVGTGLYIPPRETDDMVADGNAEISFSAFDPVSVSVGYTFEYTKEPTIPIWDNLDSETYLKLNVRLY
ncbi:tetratricopeptide repeat protein [Candidatus Fermentibacteria bacterium]|nr:tetratricopeptide repeat protein [Candidatus Fermentibacteria bacterium]